MLISWNLGFNVLPKYTLVGPGTLTTDLSSAKTVYIICDLIIIFIAALRNQTLQRGIILMTKPDIRVQLG